jgi:hypothetical protein
MLKSSATEAGRTRAGRSRHVLGGVGPLAANQLDQHPDAVDTIREVWTSRLSAAVSNPKSWMIRLLVDLTVGVERLQHGVRDGPTRRPSRPARTRPPWSSKHGPAGRPGQVDRARSVERSGEGQGEQPGAGSSCGERGDQVLGPNKLRRSMLVSRGNLTAASLRVTRFGVDLEAAHTWAPGTWPCTHTRIGGALVSPPADPNVWESMQAVRSSALEPSIGVRCNMADTGVDADDHGVVLVRVRARVRLGGRLTPHDNARALVGDGHVRS